MAAEGGELSGVVFTHLEGAAVLGGNDVAHFIHHV
jgi:hypothetical protein